MSQRLFVLFTMDVEPCAADTMSSGPSSDEAGMRSIKGYQDVLRTWGYRATYFIHPELACTQAEFFRDLAKEGNALGLHLHTTKFALDKQRCELGGLTAEAQRRILRMAVEEFEAGMGFPPTLFRPGCFSANDATYGILSELGFTGGGVSIPGRIWTEHFCVWSGAYPYAHFAHEAFRQSEGALPFVNIPLSVDLTSPLSYNPVGFYHYPDLRPGGVYDEDDEVEHDRCELLHNILRRTVADDPPVKTLVVDVHNDRDFTDQSSQAARHLQTVLQGLESECKELELERVPSTYDEVVKRFLQASAQNEL